MSDYSPTENCKFNYEMRMQELFDCGFGNKKKPVYSANLVHSFIDLVNHTAHFFDKSPNDVSSDDITCVLLHKNTLGATFKITPSGRYKVVLRGSTDFHFETLHNLPARYLKQMEKMPSGDYMCHKSWYDCKSVESISITDGRKSHESSSRCRRSKCCTLQQDSTLKSLIEFYVGDIYQNLEAYTKLNTVVITNHNQGFFGNMMPYMTPMEQIVLGTSTAVVVVCSSLVTFTRTK